MENVVIDNASLANSAVLFFIIANAYYPAKAIARHSNIEINDAEQFNKKYLNIHILFNALGVISSFLHCHYTYQTNILLKISFILTLWLTFSGVLLYLGYKEYGTIKIKILSVQRYAFWLWIKLTIVGHIII
ncbi:magnetosome protein Mad2 [Candidatus Magnetoovum chiemensis]|nr:magnetosome protein Mad2 [Candidatus Magnetoovum chiemensis]